MSLTKSVQIAVVFLCGLVGSVRDFAAMPEELEVYGLEECLSIGLTRNLVVQNLVIDLQKAEADIDGAWGVYDGRVSVEGKYQDSELPSPSVPVQGATKSLLFSTAVSRRLSTGATLSLLADSSRIEFSESFTSLNPLHISSLGLNLDHPMWGGGATSDRARIKIAEHTRDEVALEVLRRQDQVAAGIEEAYWRAYAARSLYEVNVGALERAGERAVRVGGRDGRLHCHWIRTRQGLRCQRRRQGIHARIREGTDPERPRAGS